MRHKFRFGGDENGDASDNGTDKPKKNSAAVEGKVSSSKDFNHIWFYQDVSPTSVQSLAQAIQEKALDLLATIKQFNALHGVEIVPPPLHVHIHSYGGDLFSGFAAADVVRSCPVDIHTHIEGGAASAATIFSVMGKHRTIGANSFLLIHQLSSGFWGKYEEWKDEVRNNDALMKQIQTIYKERTKLTAQKIAGILKRDLWFDAALALKYGLVDEIR